MSTYSRFLSGPVDTSPMIDVEHVDDVLLVVDAVADAVLTTSGAPLAFEGRAKWRADAMGIVGQGTEGELDASRGNRFG